MKEKSRSKTKKKAVKSKGGGSNEHQSREASFRKALDQDQIIVLAAELLRDLIPKDAIYSGDAYNLIDQVVGSAGENSRLVSAAMLKMK